MNGPELLTNNAGRLKSSMGGVFLGERVVIRGHDLHSELTNMDWIAYYVFGITGRRISPEQLRMLHAIWVNTSYPDARIWNLRVAALAGSTGSTGNLGMAAALAVSEASIYGRGIDIRAIDFLIRTRKQLDNGRVLDQCVMEELEKHRGIAGYGRPLSSVDERIRPVMAIAATNGLDNGPHVRLAHAIDEHMVVTRRRLRMNFGALSAALCADMGFSPKEYYLYTFPGFLGGTPPCYIESSERPEGTLFPLSCDHIQYEGVPKRKWCQEA